MITHGKKKVKSIEIVAREALNEQGFLRLEKLKLRNRYEDGSISREYASEMVHRRGTDSVAIIPYFFDSQGKLNVYVKRGIRPPVYRRKDLSLAVPDSSENLYTFEAIAGSLEEEDRNPNSIIARAKEEIFEELGFEVQTKQFEKLGGGFFPSHGQSSEKIHLLALKVDPDERSDASGDGSVNEGDSLTELLEARTILEMCEDGKIEDPKIEIGVTRLCRKLQYS